MTRPIGFSTGALALGDFRAALDMLKNCRATTVELSALRDHELGALVEALPTLDLQRFSYVSVHVPSQFRTLSESQVAAGLRKCIDLGISIVIHPDSIQDRDCWRSFGSLLCIENMDKRKRTGRTADELDPFFATYRDATFCFDIAHARQVDSTMTEARRMLRRFGDRLQQVHISEIDGQGHHKRVSVATVLASQSIASLIKQTTPIIIESMIPAQSIPMELDAADRALAAPSGAGWEYSDWGELA
jgi:hypothetical protein